LGHNEKQRARAETRGRSRELIAGGRHERQIVLALANDRMFLAAGTVGCRPSACPSPTIPKQVGHNHLGFGCRQHARCRPAGDCRSAEPELGPTSPGSQSSRCRRQHRTSHMDQSLENRIRERAYEMWTAHGCVHGQAEQHWLAAEREVLATSTAVFAGKPNPKKKPRSSARSQTARTVARAG